MTRPFRVRGSSFSTRAPGRSNNSPPHQDQQPTIAPAHRPTAAATRARNRALQALAYAGWSIPQVAARCGVDRQALDRALSRDRIQARTATAVAVVYDALWSSTPSATDPVPPPGAQRPDDGTWCMVDQRWRPYGKQPLGGARLESPSGWARVSAVEQPAEYAR